MKKISFIIILIIIIIICIIEKFVSVELFSSKINIAKQIAFYLRTESKLNLTYTNNNFYLIDKFSYIFIGRLDTNGLYVMKDGIKKFNFILDYNVSNTANSQILLKSPIEDNPNANTIQNIFNKTNQNIYFDFVNKVILSNDNSGNTVYLTNLIDGNPVDWNYNFNNAVMFDVVYLQN
jgi:hypothetical protein